MQIALTDAVATKDDVAIIRRRNDGLRNEFRSDNGALRTDVGGLRRDIGKCETMTNADRREAVLRADIAGHKVELIR